MSIIIFQHDEDGGPGRLGDRLLEMGHRLDIRCLWRGDDHHSIPPDLDDVDAVISLGGAANVDQSSKYPWLKSEMEFLVMAHTAGKPLVGLCLGSQLVAAALGGEVAPLSPDGSIHEIGFHEIRQTFPGTIDPLHAGVPWRSMQFHWHGQQVTKLPPGAAPLSGTKACKIQAYRVGSFTYGFQYHFEVRLDEIMHWCDHYGEALRRAGLSRELIERDARLHYDRFNRHSTRLCSNIADLLIPAVPRLR